MVSALTEQRREKLGYLSPSFFGHMEASPALAPSLLGLTSYREVSTLLPQEGLHFQAVVAPSVLHDPEAIGGQQLFTAGTSVLPADYYRGNPGW